MSRLPPWFDETVEDLDVAVLMIGTERAITYANREAHRLLGTQVGRLLGLAMDRLSVPERRGELRNIEDVLQGGAARRVRTVLRREDGTRVTVTASYEPCYNDIGVLEAVAIRYEPLALGQSLMPSGRPSGVPSLRPLGVPAEPRSSMPPVYMSGPPPRASEQRLSPMKVAAEVETRLHQLERHLRWLEDRLGLPANVASLDDPRERARALLVVADARSLVREAVQMTGLEGHGQQIPAAPKVPKL